MLKNRKGCRCFSKSEITTWNFSNVKRSQKEAQRDAECLKHFNVHFQLIRLFGGSHWNFNLTSVLERQYVFFEMLTAWKAFEYWRSKVRNVARFASRSPLSPSCSRWIIQPHFNWLGRGSTQRENPKNRVYNQHLHKNSALFMRVKFKSSNWVNCNEPR